MLPRPGGGVTFLHSAVFLLHFGAVVHNAPRIKLARSLHLRKSTPYCLARLLHFCKNHAKHVGTHFAYECKKHASVHPTVWHASCIFAQTMPTTLARSLHTCTNHAEPIGTTLACHARSMPIHSAWPGSTKKPRLPARQCFGAKTFQDRAVVGPIFTNRP